VSASASRPLRQPERFGRLWWLPDRGEGNGLDDTAWAPLAVGDIATIRALLAELRAADVPAFAAPLTGRPGGRRTRRQTLRRERPSADRYQLWVGTSGYGRAEEVLRIKLPALLRARKS
jgi:hypothetical protein